MSCHLHNQQNEISNCKVCQKPICNECEYVQSYYGGCPNCKKEQLHNLFANYKRGLIFNILSVACMIAFFIVFAIDLPNADQTFFIVGLVLGIILSVVCVTLLLRTIIKMAKLNKLLKLLK